MKKKAIKPMNSQELSTFSEQLAILLRSGVSPLEGVTLMREDLGDKGMQEAFGAVCETLEPGAPLFQALEQSRLFPPYYLRMIRIGEQSGRTDEILDSLAEYYRREEEISRSIRQAVAYPLVMILTMLCIVVVLLVKVLPIFQDVFTQLGSGLTGFSRGLMEFGQILSTYASLFLFLAVLLLCGGLYLFCSAKGKALRAKLAEKLIFTRAVSEMLAVSRFTFVMSMALQSGLDTDQSMEFAASVTENSKVKAKAEACRGQVAQGESFSRALMESGILPGVYARIASAAFRAGALDAAMKTISGRCREEADARIDRAVSLIEPTLVAVLCILVGAILLSVMLPLLGMMASL